MADTKISALTPASAAFAGQEIPVNESGTNKKLTPAQIKAFVNTAPVWAGGTESVGTWPKLEEGTLLASAEPGAFERAGNTLYATPTAQSRAVLPVTHVVTVDADTNAIASAGLQAIFPGTHDRITLPGDTTYLFELFLSVTTGGGNVSKSLAFDGGTCTFTSIRYFVMGQNGAVNTNGTAQSSGHFDTAATVSVLASATSSFWIQAKGLMRIAAGGTFFPQFAFSGSPTTPVIKKDSYMTLVPIGTGTVAAVGAWA